MRIALAVAAITAFATPVSAQDRTADDVAVRNRVAAAVTAANRRDAAAFAALFAVDADAIILDRAQSRGRAAIQAAAAKDFAAAPNERVTITPTDVRFVGADIAIVNTVARFAGGAAPSDDRGT